MPIKLSNMNFFILKDRYATVSRLGRVRGILRCHLRVAASSLFRVRPPGALSVTAATTHDAKFVFAFKTGTSKERPEHCDQGTYRHYRDKDELPRTSTWRRGKMSLRIYAASKNQAETVGMVIKNQNMLNSFARSICCRQSLA
jgi:hypothetical protein